jgi:S1-C subfamily serine protease
VDTNLDVIAAAVRGSVVQVLPGSSGGAGVVLSRGGELVVVTNAHVARGATGDRLRILSHHRTAYQAAIERADDRRDLALLALPSAASRDLSPATLGDTATVRPGQLVLAIGHPFGLANAVTAGIVHSVGQVRGIWEVTPRSHKQSWIQADIMLAPGNSGGPLLDIEGRVIGINTMVAGGLALAVPVPDIRALLQARGEAIPA